MKLGVGIIAFKRWKLLKQLLSSLERNTHLADTDFHLFQDNAVNKFSSRVACDPADIEKSVDAFRTCNLPNKTLHQQNANVGVGINQFEAYEFLTSRYAQVLILEEDIIVSPHYLRLMRLLLEQIKDRHDIFSASLGFQKLTKNVAQDMNRTRFGRIHWWSDGFYAERWMVIRPTFLEYFQLINSIDYRMRPSDTIHELFKKHHWSGTATSQDGGRDMAVSVHGLKCIVTLVNRGIYTGVEGEHSTKAFYEANHFGEQEPYVFESDAALKRFVISA